MNRRTSVTVFAVLNLIFGILGVTCAPVAALFTLFAPQLEEAYASAGIDTSAWSMMEAPGHRVYSVISLLLGLAAAGVLIAAGVGLLKLRPWGRTLSIGYVVFSFASFFVNTVVTYVVLIRPMMESAPGPEMIGGLVGSVIGHCLALVYPILLLIFMFTPTVKAAFHPPGPPVPEG